MMQRKSELLLPAGSLTKLKTAILYGADAVYAGPPDMSLRTRARMSMEELIEGVRFAHDHGKKIYLTLNLFTHNKDAQKLPQFVDTIKKLEPDGVIVADPGVFAYIKEHAPKLDLHISTQANACSYLTVGFWQRQGAALCVLGREVPFAEMVEIRRRCPDIKLEAFIHGAMCMSYSGRCLLSNYLAERSANQGNCAHSCRWNYALKLRLKNGEDREITIDEGNRDLFDFFLEEELRPGEFLEIAEDDHGAYILNSKDLCLMPKLNSFLEAGIDSLKIEGRNKSEYYVASVARAYRAAIDAYYENPEAWSPDPFLAELEKVQHRGYTLAFHEGPLTHHAHDYETTMSDSAWRTAGVVRAWEGDDLILEMRNTIEKGDVVEFLCPTRFEPLRLKATRIVDADSGVVLPKATAGQGKAIRIAADSFDHEGKVKALLPVLSVARIKAFDKDPSRGAP
jgi:U32 family peptidase